MCIRDRHQYAYGGIAFNLGGQDRVNFTTTGEVQIGSAHSTSTYSWDARLKVAVEQSANDPSAVHFGESVNGSANPAINFIRRDGSTLWSAYSGQIYYDTEKFVFATSANAGPGSHSFGTRMVIKHNGKVGIGTDNPVSALDVRNASGTDPLLSLHHSEADVIGEVIRIGRVTPYHTIRYHSIKAEHSGGETSNMLAFHLHKGGSDVDEQREVLFLRGDGRVGVGVSSPTARLHVFAPYNELGAKVGAGGTGYSNALEVYNANGALQFAVTVSYTHLTLPTIWSV